MPFPHKTFFIFFAFLSGCLQVYSQSPEPALKKKEPVILFNPYVRDGNSKHIRYSLLPKVNTSKLAYQKLGSNAINCNTSTFYMHIPASSNEKIELKELQTLPDGDFIAVGNTISSANQKNGLIIRLSNAGVLLSQQQLYINNGFVTIFNMKVTLEGDIVIAGVTNDGSNKVFIVKLKNDLSIDWIHQFQMPSLPLKVTLDLYDKDEQQIIFATQLNSSIICSSLTLNGNVKWNKKFVIDGMKELAGFSDLSFDQLGLVTNVVQNGKQLTQVSEINGLDGTLSSSGILGDSTEENKCFEITSFGDRLNLLGVVKQSTSAFKLVRNSIYGTSNIETQHVYNISGNVDFNISDAMDNAGDALGFCLPQEGKLIFIKHFSYYGTTPEYTREYAVPVGASIIAISRSFDGGYLFGLNTQNSGEVILIKTDSIGILSGCSYKDIANNFQEFLNKENIQATTTKNEIGIASDNATASFTNATLSVQFDCNQNYCPAPPIEDACLSTYFKTLRSNSYVDCFYEYFLMRNNNQLAATARYDRILGNINQITDGLKLFDERGRFIKGVNVYLDGISSGFDARQMDDKSILLNSYSIKNGLPRYTFTLVSDDLKIIWSKSFEVNSSFTFGTNGPPSQDWDKDEEGNYYFASVSEGIFNNRKLVVYKMDAFGNQLWLKAYEFEKAFFGTVKMVSTKSSLILVIDGDDGGTSLRLDKTSGQILNSFLFQNVGTGSIYKRLLKVDKDRIFYAGNTKDNEFLMGLFDTTGRPLKLRSLNNYNTIPRASTVKDGMMYVSFDYYDGTAFNDVILKADSSLNIVYVHKYPMEKYRIAQGLGVSEEGNIYEGGNFQYEGANYLDPYIIKYNNNGEIGTCNYTTAIPSITDISPQPINQSYSELQLTFQPVDIAVNFVPDDNGQQVSEILCSSVTQCNFINISGPDIICKINSSYSYKIEKNISCNLKPMLFYDTAFVIVSTSTDTTVNFIFKKPGNTWLKARLNTGCTFYDDSILVHVQKGMASISLGNDTTLCQDDSILLNAGTGFGAYKWQDGSTDSTFKVKTPGIYFVHATNSCGDAAMDTIHILSAVIPSLNIGNDTSVCAADTIQLHAPNSFSTYDWQPHSMIMGQGEAIRIAPLHQQLFTLNATTKEGCIAADSIIVNVIEAKPVYIGADTSFCDYDSVVLIAPNGYKTYIWNTGSNVASITVNNAGTYWVAAEDTNGCIAHDTLVVPQLYARPVIKLGPDTDLCEGDFLNFNPGNFMKYRWQDGSTSHTYTATKPGVYSIIVVDSNDCVGGDTIEIKNILPRPANFLNSTDSLCQYDKILIEPLQDFVAYKWSNGSTQSFITVEQPGMITLAVKDANGCLGSDTIQIIQKYCATGVFIPNAFTPNADGHNDVFRARVYGKVISFRLQLYNRFGQLVFTTTDSNKGWDGTFNGILSDTGTFVWQCSYQLQGDEPKLQKGTVLLIR